MSVYNIYGRNSRISSLDPIDQTNSNDKKFNEFEIYNRSSIKNDRVPQEHTPGSNYIFIPLIIVLVLVVLAGVAIGVSYMVIRGTITYNGLCFDTTSCNSELNLECRGLKCLCKQGVTWTGSTC